MEPWISKLPGHQVLQPARRVRGVRTHELASGCRRDTDQPVELLRWRVARFVALRRLHCHGDSWSRWLLLVEIPVDADKAGQRVEAANVDGHYVAQPEAERLVRHDARARERHHADREGERIT